LVGIPLNLCRCVTAILSIPSNIGLRFRIHQIQQEREGNWSLGWEREIQTEIQESRLGLVLFFDATNALGFVLK
jgi:hypothetical protein